jgi:hypothetical protein
MRMHDHSIAEDDGKLHLDDGVYRIVMANGCSVSSPGFTSGVPSSSSNVVRDVLRESRPGAKYRADALGRWLRALLGLLKSIHSTGGRQNSQSIEFYVFFFSQDMLPYLSILKVLRGVEDAKMFHAGKNGAAKYESYGDAIEKPSWLRTGICVMSRMNGGPNIGQMKPFSTLSCEHFVSVALPRSSACKFLIICAVQRSVMGQRSGWSH